jgi:hypothetical protein
MVAAAATVSTIHHIGEPGRSLTGDRVVRVISPLDTTIVLMENDATSLCVVACNAGNLGDAEPLLRESLSRILGIPLSSTAVFVSHNHCDVELAGPRDAGAVTLTAAGERLVSGIENAARTLRGRLTPVTVAAAVDRCDSISYNRKGRRHDGTTYFMREEDRAELGGDYSGEIDSDAPVLLLLDDERRPVCSIVSFTAHPVTVYHPELPIVAGEYCQTASRFLSDWTGGAPTAFIQGCAGDTNSKRFLTLDPPAVKAEYAAIYGVTLGAAFARAADAAMASSVESGAAQAAGNDILCFERRTVELPYASLPPEEEVRSRIIEIEAFFERCRRGDEDTLYCAGLNPSRTMSPRYRTGLIEPVHRWYRWAEAVHAGKEPPPLSAAPVEMFVARIGRAAVTGFACEAFSTIGKAVKRSSPAAATITGSYFGCFGATGYVPDGRNHRDLDYVSSFYRYRPGALPFADPAGDRLADEASALLELFFS